MGKIYVVGMGPGKKEYMTFEAVDALEASDLIVGYTVYINLVKQELYPSSLSGPEGDDTGTVPTGKEFISTGMGRERDRCEICLEKASEGKTVSLVCSGDAQIYGMAGLLYEMREEMGLLPECDIEVVAGVSAAQSCGALLGAPLGNDFCAISLSDYLTPWEVIGERLKSGAKGDFVLALYNPASHKRPDHLKRACDILLEFIEPERPCGLVENAGRGEEKIRLCTLGELRDAEVNMFTTVFVGSSATGIIDGKLVTSRGYKYACPCCGRRTLTEEPGSYEICPVCGWEDDPLSRRDPAFTGGANKMSLEEARRARTHEA